MARTYHCKDCDFATESWSVYMQHRKSHGSPPAPPDAFGEGGEGASPLVDQLVEAVAAYLPDAKYAGVKAAFRRALQAVQAPLEPGMLRNLGARLQLPPVAVESAILGVWPEAAFAPPAGQGGYSPYGRPDDLGRRLDHLEQLLLGRQADNGKISPEVATLQAQVQRLEGDLKLERSVTALREDLKVELAKVASVHQEELGRLASELKRPEAPRDDVSSLVHELRGVLADLASEAGGAYRTGLAELRLLNLPQLLGAAQDVETQLGLEPGSLRQNILDRVLRPEPQPFHPPTPQERARLLETMKGWAED